MYMDKQPKENRLDYVMNIGGIPLVGIMKINLVDFLVGIMGNHHKPWRTNQPICRLMIDTARYK